MFYYSGKLHILLSIDWKKTCSYTTVVLSAGMYLFILVYREKLNKDFLFFFRNCGFFLFVTDVLLSFFYSKCKSVYVYTSFYSYPQNTPCHYISAAVFCTFIEDQPFFYVLPLLCAHRPSKPLYKLVLLLRSIYLSCKKLQMILNFTAHEHKAKTLPWFLFLLLLTLFTLLLLLCCFLLLGGSVAKLSFPNLFFTCSPSCSFCFFP